jgi:hypothetical protein
MPAGQVVIDDSAGGNLLDERVTGMTRARIGGLVVGLLAALALATSVSATSPRPVTITVLTNVDGNLDAFVSTGGLVCAAGEVSAVSSRFVGFQNGQHAQILVDKRFECADGRFDILLRVTLDFETCDTVGTWSVLDGTGAYATLRGAGSVTGDSPCDDTILDVYTGSMHFDR